MTRLVLALGIVAALSGCGGEQEPPPLLDQVGDPCRGLAASCLDEATELACVDGRWAERSCAQRCAEEGPAMVAVGCVDDGVSGCACEPAEGACEAGAARCDSEAALGWCDAEQSWTSYDCAELCAQSPATPTSLGCVSDEGGASCLCTAEGSACAADEVGSCVDAGALLRCVDEVWVLVECDEACGGAGSCEPWADEGAAGCVCG